MLYDVTIYWWLYFLIALALDPLGTRAYKIGDIDTLAEIVILLLGGTRNAMYLMASASLLVQLVLYLMRAVAK